MHHELLTTDKRTEEEAAEELSYVCKGLDKYDFTGAELFKVTAMYAAVSQYCVMCFISRSHSVSTS